jgi:hypothetical protein
MLKHLFILVAVVFQSALHSQNLPYQAPQETDLDAVINTYLMNDTENEFSILRLLRDQKFELITYHKNNDLICEYSKGQTTLYKNKLSLYTSESLEIIRSGDLNLIRPCSNKYNNDLSTLFLSKSNFYSKKIHLLFKKRAVIVPCEKSLYTKQWFIHPLSGDTMVSRKCFASDDLDCLCAALTFEKSTEREKSDAISAFIISRFKYNRGDTAQTNVKGLVFGKEKEAVCEGYSRVYKDLMERIGIKTHYVSGAVKNTIQDVFYSGHSHAWNQVVLDNIPYTTDITWSQNIHSNWYLMKPKDMIISHFEDNQSAENPNLYDSTLTMYDFMQLPYVDPIERNGHNQLSNLDKTSPIQFAQGTFTINFKQKMNVTNITRNELGYPFVRFEGEKNEVARKVIANDGKLTNKISTNSISVNLPELINYLTIDIDGIGTLHYIVINGTENQFYESLISNLDQKNAYSMAIAFLACAKLKNEKIYNELKIYMAKPMKFKDFIKEAEKMNISQFKFSIFDACHHVSYSYKEEAFQESDDENKYQGYSFSFSNLPNNEEGKIFMKVEKSTGTYKFKAFAKNSWGF